MMKKKEFQIQGASQKLIAMDLTYSESNTSLVIFAHGFKGFKDWGTHNIMAHYFAEQGFNFLKFNFSHNGTTVDTPLDFSDLDAFASNTFSKELFDLDQVITFTLSGTAFPVPASVNLIGHSRGGGICIIQTAEDKRIKKLATWASLSRFRSLWMTEQEKKWRNEGLIYIENARTKQQMPLKIDLLHDLEHHSEKLDILSSARRIEQPWLIIHSEKDTSVSVEQALELNRQQQIHNAIFLIAESDHVFGAKHPWNETKLPEALKKVCDTTISFFKNGQD